MADLAKASESGWAPVQNLLAAREVCDRDGDTAAVQAIDDELASLGFAV